NKSAEGAAIGAGTGGMIGGVLGWLAGVGMLTLPGVGPLLAAGPIVAALSGAAVGGTVGGVAGGLTGLGFSDDEVNRYLGRIKEGHTPEPEPSLDLVYLPRHVIKVHRNQRVPFFDAAQVADRKSTRLNSSHTSIQHSVCS